MGSGPRCSSTAPDESHRTRPDTTERESPLMDAIVQIVGSLFVLVPFVLVQFGKLTPSTVGFLLANVIGSGILAVDALIGQQWGFLLLEGVWAIVSVVGLVRTIVGKPTTSVTH